MSGIGTSRGLATTSETVRILGIDPGLQTTGFGVIDAQGPQMHYVASGTIRTRPADGALLPDRLRVIFEGITEVVQRYQPQVAACEIVFVNVNPQATLLLGQARGCCLTALVANGLPVAEYTALQLKKAVTGHGKAHKDQVQEMVRRLLQLPGLPGKDAADALGLCITHAQVARTTAAIHQVSPLQARTHAAYKAGRHY
jgi:crossover junction endodeoxyribonuclease RuvC